MNDEQEELEREIKTLEAAAAKEQKSALAFREKPSSPGGETRKAPDMAAMPNRPINPEMQDAAEKLMVKNVLDKIQGKK